MKIKTILLIVILSFFIGVINSYGFCIYNVTDTKIRAVEEKGGDIFNSFAETLGGRTVKCCSWKNKNCNINRKKDSILIFRIFAFVRSNYYDNRNLNGEYKIVCEVEINADGVIVVKGGYGKYECSIPKD